MFQLGSALLDACVLAVISKEDTYGYLLTQEIRNIIEVSESTLYPVLRRLQSEKMLVTYDSAYNGRNRRYYQITPNGREHLQFLQNNWKHFKAAVDYLLITTPTISTVKSSEGTDEVLGAQAEQESEQKPEIEAEQGIDENTEGEPGVEEEQDSGKEQGSEEEQDSEGDQVEGEQS